LIVTAGVTLEVRMEVDCASSQTQSLEKKHSVL